MFASSRLGYPLSRWLTSIGAIVAIVAQLSVAFAPLVEAREGASTAAHVEFGGTSTHYAHNDATCAVCQGRLLQGLAPRPAAQTPTGTLSAMPLTEASDRFRSPELLSRHNPRAPPRI